MSETILPCVEIEAEGPARFSIIWLHGLGADGNDFVPIVPALRLDPSLGVRFVFPHAPSMPVSLNMGMVMPAWFDVRDPDLRLRPDIEGLRRSAVELLRLIERENERGVPCERILLAGFSQGGAVAAHVALRHPEPLLGLVALSTYLVGPDELEAELVEANRSIPIFQAHGMLDPMVTPDRGTASRDHLVELGYAVDWHAYPMQHEVCIEEIDDLGSWIRARLEA